MSMKVVFKVIKEDESIKVEPLFLNADSSCHNTSLENIIRCMRELIPDEKKDTIKFVSLYTDINEDNFMDSKNEAIEILVRLKNGIPDTVLMSDDRYSGMSNTCDLLNKESTDETLSYVIYRVCGKLTNR